jgi:hypothetical protein
VSEPTPPQRRALQTIANGTPGMFLVHGVYRSCSLCAAHIEVARESLGWASLPEMAGVPRPLWRRLVGELQWPALGMSLAGAWMVADPRASYHAAGFACFLLANVLWLAWGVNARAWALVIMQLLFTITSIRGLWSNL